MEEGGAAGRERERGRREREGEREREREREGGGGRTYVSTILIRQEYVPPVRRRGHWATRSVSAPAVRWHRVCLHSGGPGVQTPHTRVG